MPMVTGKNASDAEITAFGSSPLNPACPSTTTIIGAVASTGMDCETITHGSNPRSSSLECTIAVASAMPMPAARAKPASAASSVTPA